MSSPGLTGASAPFEPAILRARAGGLNASLEGRDLALVGAPAVHRPGARLDGRHEATRGRRSAWWPARPAAPAAASPRPSARPAPRVYCTGRSTRGRPPRSAGPRPSRRPPSCVTARGRRGIAVRVDHADEAQVAALCRRIRAEHGRARRAGERRVGRREAHRVRQARLGDVDPDRPGRCSTRAALHPPRHREARRRRSCSGGSARSSSRSPTATGSATAAWSATTSSKMSVMRLAFVLSRELAPKGVTALAVTPGLPPLGGDARALRRHGGHAGATPREVARLRRLRRRRSSSAGPSRRSPPTRTWRSAPGGCSARGTLAARVRLHRRRRHPAGLGAHFEDAVRPAGGAADDAAYASWRGGPAAAVLGDWP